MRVSNGRHTNVTSPSRLRPCYRNFERVVDSQKDESALGGISEKTISDINRVVCMTT